jgi:hypothetical protein
VETRLKGYRYFVVEVFQDVLDKLSDVGKKDKLLKFFKLVQDGKFPLHSIAFELFLDIVEWFDKDESRRNEIFAMGTDIDSLQETISI